MGETCRFPITHPDYISGLIDFTCKDCYSSALRFYFKNFKTSHERKENLGLGLEHTHLVAMDTFASVNEW
jgi:hypothetical protein